MTKNRKRVDIQEMVTGRVIEALKKGKNPWVCPWVGCVVDGVAYNHGCNFTTKKAYRGANRLLTNISGFDSPFFLSFKQMVGLGGKLRPEMKGKSTPIVYWNWIEKEDESPKGIKKIPFLRYSSVWNADQIEGVDFGVVERVSAGEEKIISRCEEVVKGYENAPPITHGGNACFYTPSVDKIKMVAKSSFKRVESYYCTLFHELIHSTGHKSRTGRLVGQEGASFASASYSKEELVAEMGAGFLAAECGIYSRELSKNSVAYLRGWLSRLGEDKKLILQASSAANKAVDYIKGGSSE